MPEPGISSFKIGHPLVPCSTLGYGTRTECYYWLMVAYDGPARHSKCHIAGRLWRSLYTACNTMPPAVFFGLTGTGSLISRGI